MKRLLLLFTILIYILGCKQDPPKLTTQQRAERLIKSYLDSTLNDRKSYEAVKFDSIEPVFGTYLKFSPEGKKLQAQFQTVFDKYLKYVNGASDEILKRDADMDEYQRLSNLGDYYKSKIDSLDLLIKSKSIGFRGPIVGYTIEHKYRAKNGFGATMLGTTRFEIDGHITQVKKAKELKGKDNN